MSKNATWCSKVSDGMNCPKCKEKKVIKNGRTKNYKQQYYCKMCCHRFIENYTNQAYKLEINQKIVQLTKEGLGIRSTAKSANIFKAMVNTGMLFVRANPIVGLTLGIMVVTGVSDQIYDGLGNSIDSAILTH